MLFRSFHATAGKVIDKAENKGKFFNANGFHQGEYKLAVAGGDEVIGDLYTGLNTAKTLQCANVIEGEVGFQLLVGNHCVDRHSLACPQPDYSTCAGWH